MLHRPLEPGQYTSIAFTNRLISEGVDASVGTTGDAYDCEKNQEPPGRGLTLAYDWPWCLGVDLSAPGQVAINARTGWPGGR